MATTSTHSDTLVRTGRCDSHGLVQATKQVPKIRFPFIVFGAMRLWAQTRPFRCPVCGAAVATT